MGAVKGELQHLLALSAIGDDVGNPVCVPLFIRRTLGEALKTHTSYDPKSRSLPGEERGIGVRGYTDALRLDSVPVLWGDIGAVSVNVAAAFEDACGRPRVSLGEDAPDSIIAALHTKDELPFAVPRRLTSARE